MTRSTLWALLITSALIHIALASPQCKSDSVMCTRWTKEVRAGNAHSEYPRPQMTRSDWQTLNGLWQYAITGREEKAPDPYQGTILVPYPLESVLSGVKRRLEPNQLLWYSRKFSPRGLSPGKRLLLHFGAVDFATTVYVNGLEVGTHSGGYQRFTFDITEAVKSGTNDLVVKVFDPTERGMNPRGKQALYPMGIVYTGSSGIWQTVWLEVVPQTYIESVRTTPNVRDHDAEIAVKVAGASADYELEAVATEGSKVVAAERFVDKTTLRIESPHVWSPEDPFLYGLRIRLMKSGEVVDEVNSYFGMRSVEVKADSNGHSRIYLNGRYTYNLGVLDQGYWPDGLYTAPTEEALKFDVLAAKAMGFNTIRKHIKIEPDRWYYYCDELGMLVWQDMVPPGNSTTEAQTEFVKEVEENMEELHNHPSITTWVLFNEGWGSYDQERIASWMRSLDPTRLIDVHSGPNVTHVSDWSRDLSGAELLAVVKGDVRVGLRSAGFDQPADWAGGDMVDIHAYPDPMLPPFSAGKVPVIGEYGGVSLPVDGHLWDGIPGQFQQDVAGPSEFAAAYRHRIDMLKALESQGLSGSVYTQPFDVEREQNGLITYDRATIKIPLREIARINRTIVSGSPASRRAMLALSVKDADPTPLSKRYVSVLRTFRQGNRSQSLLRHLSLMALQVGDQDNATVAGNLFIDQSKRPYSDDTWKVIRAVTHTSRDRGFALLRSDTARADEVLGENVAESLIRAVIAEEEVDPYVKADTVPDWHEIEERTIRKYGALGAEEVRGAEMLYYMARSDWPNFAKYFELYFSTASERSEYPLSTLSYLIFEHLDDPRALESAIAACSAQVDPFRARGQIDPVTVDTYANLLYKLGRTHEAIEWEERAVRMSDGRSTAIVGHLSKMKAGQATWMAQR